METRYKPRGFPQRLGSLRLPLFPQPRRRYYLPAINLGVGPFYSIKVGSFYVVKATKSPKHAREPLTIGWRPTLTMLVRLNRAVSQRNQSRENP